MPMMWKAEFAPKLKVRALANYVDKLVVDNVYDAATGEIVQERVRQADEAKAPTQ